MKTFTWVFLLLVLSLSLGCGSNPEPPPLDEGTRDAVAEEDATVDAAESQQ